MVSAVLGSLFSAARLTESHRGLIFSYVNNRTEVCTVPIYEYQCSKCGEVFEAFQKITDEPLSKCKFCQGKVEKLISQSSFQLKGSGWYLTDYARRSSSGPSDKPKADKTSEKATETKTDSTSTATGSDSKS
jgi:putative FmdB family regulatory protein